MRLRQLNIVKNVPCKPYVCVEGEFIQPSYKVLWKMYDRIDYVLRVIGQVIEGYPEGIFTKGEILALTYVYVRDKQNYLELCQSIIDAAQRGEYEYKQKSGRQKT